MSTNFLAAFPGLPADFVPNDFATATKISSCSTAENSYEVDLKQDWAIGLVPHGGYLAGIIAQAAKHHSSLHHPDLQQTDLITMHQEFVSACVFGPARITVTELSKGRQYSTLRVQMFQHPGDDRSKTPILRIEALIRQGSLQRESSSGGISLPTRPLSKFGLIPPRAECVERKDEPELFARRTAYTKVVMLLDANTTSLGNDPKLGPSVREQWITWRNEQEGFDIPGVCYLADLHRPLIEAYEVRGNWFPTLSMSVEMKKGPPAGGWKWLFMRIEMHQVKDGRFDYDVVIFDEEGELVALSKHVALAVPSERNYKRRYPTKM